MRNKLSEVELIVIDEISMVSQKVFFQVHQRLIEIFGVQLPFAGKSVLVCGDLYQLPPVRAFPVFNNRSVENCHPLQFAAIDLWRMFKIVELTEIMRQQGHNEMIDMLNKIRVGTIDISVDNLLQSRFVDVNNPAYPVNATHIFAENAPANDHNENMLNRLNSPLIIIHAIDELPSNCNISETDILSARNRKATETGGLAIKLSLKLEARVMLTVNVDIADMLTNGQMGIIKHFKQNEQNRVITIYVKFDDSDVGKKLSSSNNLAKQNFWVPITATDTKIKIKPRTINLPTIQRTQFPLMLSWACTIHKVQGLSLQTAVISFDLNKQWALNAGQMYVALSHVTSMEGLFLKGSYSRDTIRVSTCATEEYDRVHQNSPFIPLEKVETFENCFVFGLFNTRSLKKHAIDMASDENVLENDVIFLTETQLHPHTEVSCIKTKLQRFNFNFNSSDFKFSSLAIAYKDSVQILDHEKHCGISLLTICVKSLSDRLLRIALIYKTNTSSI